MPDESHKGKRHSEKTKEKLSKVMKGKNLGKHYSEESRKNMSDAHKGLISNKKGKKASEETIKKLSKSHIGKKLSKETKKKMSESRLNIFSGFNKLLSTRYHLKYNNIINDWFKGCEKHHININMIICIPKEIHQKFYHDHKKPETMIEINNRAFEYLTNSMRQL